MGSPFCQKGEEAFSVVWEEVGKTLSASLINTKNSVEK